MDIGALIHYLLQLGHMAHHWHHRPRLFGCPPAHHVPGTECLE